MKKTLLAIILGGMAFATTNASANTGTINFNGKITSATCTIEPEVNGNRTSTIDLGQAAISGHGTVVDFKLKPAVGSNDCLAKTNARIDWSGSMNNSGFNNTATGSTAAKGYHMSLRATNVGNGSGGANINASFSAAEYTHTAAIQSFNYSAQLKKDSAAPSNGGYKAGVFTTSASFSVTYM
ncbi:TPA: type 1 fimbrial protein [Escherichia coli]|nr:type 1 fimbrial protein [Escherichia coli]